MMATALPIISTLSHHGMDGVAAARENPDVVRNFTVCRLRRPAPPLGGREGHDIVGENIARYAGVLRRGRIAGVQS
jgi:hypothetical protein